MANHCYNYGYFTGTKENIDKLVKQVAIAKRKDLEDKTPTYEWEKSLNNINLWAGNYHKILASAPDLDEEGNAKPGFDVYNKYGSKWFELYIEVQPSHGDEAAVVITGDSAWSPMLPLFLKICKKYKLRCDGNYEESGMDFAGEFSIIDDELVEEQMTYREYQQKHNPECFWDDVINWIEDGYFENLKDVLAEFNPDIWELNSDEITELAKIFNNYLEEKEKLDKQS